jgi:hypothetical protein
MCPKMDIKVSNNFNGNCNNNKLVLTRKQIPNVSVLLASSDSHWNYLDTVKASANFHRSPITPYDKLHKKAPDKNLQVFNWVNRLANSYDQISVQECFI